jgi:hypothetical protein
MKVEWLDCTVASKKQPSDLLVFDICRGHSTESGAIEGIRWATAIKRQVVASTIRLVDDEGCDVAMRWW